MRPRRRKWTGGIVAASLAAHVAVLTVLALHAPRLRIPREVPGPPEAVIPVLIIPRTPPPAAAPGARAAAHPPVTAASSPTCRRRRRWRRWSRPTVEAKPAPTTAPGPRVVVAPPAEDPIAVNARQALRGKLGCANASLLGLSREEREKCEERWRPGQDGGLPGTGIDADKAGGLAAAARRKEADYAYKRSAAPAAPGGRIGSTAEELGKSLGNDKPTAKVPF
jgi:hypothetical protein